MSDVVLPLKRCHTCHERKPLSAFSRRSDQADGLATECRPCAAERYARNRRSRIERDGIEAERARGRANVQRHRARTANETGKRWNAARTSAVRALIARHREEYDRLMLLATRGELPDPD